MIYDVVKISVIKPNGEPREVHHYVLEPATLHVGGYPGDFAIIEWDDADGTHRKELRLADRDVDAYIEAPREE